MLAVSDIILIPIVAFVGFIAGAVATYIAVSKAHDHDELLAPPTWTFTTTYGGDPARDWTRPLRDDDGTSPNHYENEP